jgi:hypothetical protein
MKTFLRFNRCSASTRQKVLALSSPEARAHQELRARRRWRAAIVAGVLAAGNRPPRPAH